jgi:hypothetical protein
MSSSEIRENDPNTATDGAAPPDQETETIDQVQPKPTEDRSTRRHSARHVIAAAERDRMLDEARKVDFPSGLRGYSRGAVDDYVERMNRVLADLEMSSSPESAVRHALEEVSEETRDILQHAHQTADEITARSRSKADERLQVAAREAQEMLDVAQREAQQAREAAQHDAHETREAAQREATELRETAVAEILELREGGVRETQQLRAAAQREADATRSSARHDADDMRERAETRTRELARNADAIWRERRRLIEDMRAAGEQLVDICEVEAKRFPRPPEELSPREEPTRVHDSTPVGDLPGMH